MDRLVRRVLLAAGACAAVVGIYGRCVEPRRLVVREVPVSLGARLGPVPTPGDSSASATGAAGTGLRIAHLTDFHLSPEVPLAFIRQAIERTLLEKPDLICLTGDFITDYLRQEDAYAEALALLPAAAPTFAVAGNHDGGIWAQQHGGYPSPGEVEELLRRAGITYLANATVVVEARGRKVAIAGLGDLWAGNSRPEAVAGALDRSQVDLRIVMVHNPDAKESLAALRWDLLLAGHTHGGQLILPLLGAPFAPVRDKTMIKGLHAWRGRKIHISPGVGNLHGMRIFSPPEISLLLLPP